MVWTSVCTCVRVCAWRRKKEKGREEKGREERGKRGQECI